MRNLRTCLRQLGVLVLLPFLGAATPAKEGRLFIEVRGFKNASGRAPIAIFHERNADAFPAESDQSVTRRALPINADGTARLEIPKLPYGSYAAILFHDEDGNGELATNFLGIPKEGLGISNNFKPRFGPPGFEDARFAFEHSDQVITFDLQY